MKFTVVPSVRPAGLVLSATTERLRPVTDSDVPSRSTTMDVPFADTVLKLDFTGTDFSDTVPTANL